MLFLGSTKSLELIVLGAARFAVGSVHLGTAVGLGGSPIGPQLTTTVSRNTIGAGTELPPKRWPC